MKLKDEGFTPPRRPAQVCGVTVDAAEGSVVQPGWAAGDTPCCEHL